MASKTLKASVIIGGSLSSSFRGAMGDAKSGLQGIGTAIANVERRQRLMAQGIEQFGRIGRNVDGLRQRYAQLERQANSLRAAQERLARATERVGNNADARAAVGGQLAGAVGLGAMVAAPVALTVGNASQFEREIQLIANTATAKELQEFGGNGAIGKTILEAAKATNQFANETQAAFGMLIAAGRPLDETAASIGTIGRTATAAGADVRDIATASETLLGTLAVAPNELQKTLDVLATAGKEGKFELKAMARVLPTLGAGFKSLKMEGEEAAATMGAALQIARIGAGSDEEAANNMQNFLAKLMSPGTRKKAMKNFGVDIAAEIKDAQKRGENPFEAAMESVKDMVGDDPKKLGDLFEDMQVQNFVRPMIQNWDDYAKIKRKALTQSDGTTTRDFEAMMSTSAERMKAARVNVDILSKSIGTALLPAIGDLAQALTPVVQRIGAFVEQNPKLVGGILKGVVALAGLKIGFLALRYAVLAVQAPFLRVAQAVAKFRAGKAAGELGRMGMAAARAGGWIMRIGAAIGALGVGPLLVIGATLAGAALIVRKFWEPIKAYVLGFITSLSATVQPAFAQVGAALAPLKPVWDAVAGAIGKVWDWFVKILEPVGATSEATKRAGEAGMSFGAAVGGAINFVIGRFVAVIKVVSAVVSFLIKGASLISTAWQVAFGWIGRVWGAAKGAVATVGSALGIGGAPASLTASGMPTPAGRPAPKLPAAGGRAGASQKVDNSQHKYEIRVDGAGDPKAVAREVAAELKRTEQARNRGRLADGMPA